MVDLEKKAKIIVDYLRKNINEPQQNKISLEPIFKELRLFIDDSFIINNVTINENIPSEIDIDCARVLLNTFNAKIFATSLKKYEISEIKMNAFNKQISKLIKLNYDLDDLLNIFEVLFYNGVFNLFIDKTGYFKTAILQKNENWEMGERFWLTDSEQVAREYLRNITPEAAKRISINNANFYNFSEQLEQFEKVHNSEKIIKNVLGKDVFLNKYYETPKPNIGLAHIMIYTPNSNKDNDFTPDPNWGNNKRLESHGLVLRNLIENIIDGIVFSKKYGFSTNVEISDNIIKCIVLLATYFDDINYPYASSAGNWEETPFAGGLTYDTAIIVEAFICYHQLMFNDDYSGNNEILAVRQRVKDYTTILRPNSKDKILNEKYILDLIEKGKNRVKKYYLEEAPGVRPIDASLAFIPSLKHFYISENLYEDIKLKLDILKLVEENLVREFGMIRYVPFDIFAHNGDILCKSPDSYLNIDYNVAQNPLTGKISLKYRDAVKEFGSTDASSPEKLAQRAKLAAPLENKEAQWFMVQDIGKGYVKLLLNLLLTKNNVGFDEKDIILINTLKNKCDEYVNRSLIRITDLNQYKANGFEATAWKIPEAYQYVHGINSEEVLIPGANTPLAWAQASLYSLLFNYLNVLNILKLNKI